MRSPYRVAIWGPGTVGGALLRRVIRKPEFELAGVLAWSESKVGKDAGDIVGLGPTGITVSGDPEEIYEVYNSGPLSADLLSVAGFGADPSPPTGTWARRCDPSRCPRTTTGSSPSRATHRRG